MKDYIILKVRSGDTCIHCPFRGERFPNGSTCLLFKENLLEEDEWGTSYKCDSCLEVCHNAYS